MTENNFIPGVICGVLITITVVFGVPWIMGVLANHSLDLHKTDTYTYEVILRNHDNISRKMAYAITFPTDQVTASPQNQTIGIIGPDGERKATFNVALNYSSGKDSFTIHAYKEVNSVWVEVENQTEQVEK